MSKTLSDFKGLSNVTGTVFDKCFLSDDSSKKYNEDFKKPRFENDLLKL